MADPFHLSWFLQGSNVQAWGAPWTGNIAQEWMTLDLFKHLARELERACFDYLLIEDSIYIGESWQNSRDIYLRTGFSCPRQEPSVMSAVLAAATERLGIVTTLSTFAYAPYLTARLVGTLDQISSGRAGWNVVTGSSDLAAQNLGLEALAPHDQRYVMAEEYVEIVKRLWASWEPDVLVDDRKAGILFDPKKVHAIDFKGQYYSSRGPLNSGPTVQSRPVIAQAGGSEVGMTFAARHADTIVSMPSGVENMKRYRDSIRKRMETAGRDPDQCKVLFLVVPIVAETETQARWLADQRAVQSEKNIEERLARLGWVSNIDFSQFDLDQPVGKLETNGNQSIMAQFVQRSGKNTLREAVVAYYSTSYCVDLIGTPDSVASQMQEVMEEIGGDGFLITLHDLSRRSLATIIDGLVPELQQRGLVRTGYEHKQLRDNLLAF